MTTATIMPRIERRPLNLSDFDARTAEESLEDDCRLSGACERLRVKDARPVRELDEIGEAIYTLIDMVERWDRRYPFNMPEKKAERLNLAISFKDYEIHRTLDHLRLSLIAIGDLF